MRYGINVSMRTFLNAVDLLILVFVLFLTSVAVIFISSVNAWPQLIFTYLLVALVVIALAALDQRNPGGKLFRFLHAFIPIACVLLIFNSLGDLIPGIRHRYYDDILIGIDYRIFHVHPTVWLERFNNPLLTGLLQAAYISYYFMPIALAASLFLKNRHREFKVAVFALVLCFFLSYIGYMLVPAVGPRFTLHHLQTMGLHAGPLTAWVQRTLDALEHNKTDAFPSGHTAVALVSLYYAGKFGEKVLFRILVPAVSALIVSTVYLRYHYVIDVVAGVLLAALTIFIAPLTQRIFSGSHERSAD
jgi:membrane-associated phospholipid phosphatase